MDGGAPPSDLLGDGISYVIPAERYALLVSAKFDEDGPKFYRNLATAYDSLLSHGFKEENITVLYADGNDEPAHRYAPASQDGGIVDSEASTSSVRQALADLAGRVTAEDELFVYISDHGGRKEGVSNLAFPGDPATGTGTTERIDELEFKGMLDAVDSMYKVVVLDECYGGGFAERLGAGNTIAIAACRAKEYTYATSRFVPHLLDTLAGTDPKADANGDGRISIKEAFDHAERREHTFLRTITFTAQHPVIHWGDVDPETVAYGRSDNE